MRFARAAAIVLLFAMGACGSVGPTAGSTPTPATSSASVTPSPTMGPSPSPSPSPTPALVRAGAPAWIAVSVATEWRSPTSPRSVDAPALANPARIRQWLGALTASDQAGLIDRADSQMLLGDRVQVLAISGKWARIAVPDQSTPLDSRGYPGWVPIVQLSAVAPPGTASVVTVVTPTAWLMEGGAASTEVSFGTRLPAILTQGSTVHVGLPGGATADVDVTKVVLSASGGAAGLASASAVIASARLFLGIRYLWAGTSGFGFDCSGFVYNVFKVHGVLLPRDADAQARVGIAVGRQSLRPGDLVFLARGGVVHHVALYVGSRMLLDSPDLGKVIGLVSITAQPYASEFSGARRVLP